MKQEQITQFLDGLNLDPQRKLLIRSLINAILDNTVEANQIATDKDAGVVKIGYKANAKNYPLLIDGEGRAYIAVPWTDTKYNVVGTQNTTGLIKNGSAVTSADGYTPCPIINGIPYYKEPAAPASAEPAVAVLEHDN